MPGSGESIKREGLRLNKEGVCFVTGSEDIAVEYGMARVAYDMIFHGGPNRVLIVIAHLPSERLTRMDREPKEGELPCLAKEDGYTVEGGVKPDEIAEMLTGTLVGLESATGLLEALTNHFYWKEMIAAAVSGSRQFDIAYGYDEQGNPV